MSISKHFFNCTNGWFLSQTRVSSPISEDSLNIRSVFIQKFQTVVSWQGFSTVAGFFNRGRVFPAWQGFSTDYIWIWPVGILSSDWNLSGHSCANAISWKNPWFTGKSYLKHRLVRQLTTLSSSARNSQKIRNSRPSTKSDIRENLDVTQNRNVNRTWLKCKLPIILYEELKYP
jgi:hypothetical protein